MTTCPCGSAEAFARCCGPYLDGSVQASTAERLARARYSAYTRQQVSFLLRTYTPDRQYLFDRETTLAWARRSQWLGFEIKRTTDGGPSDEQGTVEFVASYLRDGLTCRHHEIADFRKHDGLWYYVDGTYPDADSLLGAESRRLKR